MGRYIIGTEVIRGNCISAVLDLPLDYSHEVIIRKAKSKRSLQANKLYWKWLQYLADETGYTREQWHEYFKAKFIAPKTEMITMFDKTVPEKPVTTTRESVKEFTEYLNEIELWVMDNMGYSFPQDDDYKTAMRKD
jgi:hypothetical protein